MTTQGQLRVLLIDDFEPFRSFCRKLIEPRRDVIALTMSEDGLQGVQLAAELQPDLILIDIGLSTISGIEAAKQIRTVAPHSKILFVTQQSSPALVREAFRLGTSGYLLKADAFELLTAIDAVLRGERYVSLSLEGIELDPADG